MNESAWLKAYTALHVTIKEGKIEEFKRLVEEMGKAVRLTNRVQRDTNFI